MPETWEVFALRYARLPERTRRESLLGVDPHDSAPMPLDYYVWVLRAGGRVILVDTGFDAAEGPGAGGGSSASRARPWPCSASTPARSRT